MLGENMNRAVAKGNLLIEIYNIKTYAYLLVQYIVYLISHSFKIFCNSPVVYLT
jgi:hypothetical protein